LEIVRTHATFLFEVIGQVLNESDTTCLGGAGIPGHPPPADDDNASSPNRRSTMSDAIDFDEVNRSVISEFRETGGRAGGMFEGKPLVLVHHTGAKSGKARIAPLVPYLDGDRIFIFASKGGADHNPDWYHNLVAHPQTVVELGSETFPVTPRVLTGDERDDVYAKQSAVQPQFADYQRKTTRLIPVLELKRADR
jgi:deazaflavin-dependent oxidoreductase (nitroreductase family)